MKPPRERDIQRAILEHCNRLPGVVVWRANSGAVTATYKGKTRFVRFNTMPGCSDLIGWRTRSTTSGLRLHAQFVAIEVKRPGQKPTPIQTQFLKRVEEAGGFALVATSVDDIIASML